MALTSGKLNKKETIIVWKDLWETEKDYNKNVWWIKEFKNEFIKKSNGRTNKTAEMVSDWEELIKTGIF